VATASVDAAGFGDSLKNAFSGIGSVFS